MQQWTPWSEPERNLRKAVVTLNDFAREVIEENRSKVNQGESENLLLRCLAISDEEGKPVSDKFLRDMIMNFSTIQATKSTRMCAIY